MTQEEREAEDNFAFYSEDPIAVDGGYPGGINDKHEHFADGDVIKNPAPAPSPAQEHDEEDRLRRLAEKLRKENERSRVRGV